MSDVRALASWCGALAGLLAILIGGLVPAALFLPAPEPILLPLPVTWQVPALLLCAMVNSPRAGVMAAVGYLSLGLFSLPVFHGGGGLNYVLEPGFGYLAGFVPAAWLTGRLAQQDGMDDLPRQSLCALAGLLVLQICGVLNLALGALLGRWSLDFPELLMQFSIGPLPAQMLLCIGAGFLSIVLRRLLIIEP